MSLHDSINDSRHKLELIKDILILPPTNSKKVKKAIKKYVPNRNIGDETVLLLIDNTILRSGKQGMIITSKMLHSFSNISGKFSIPLKDIDSLSPQVRRALGNPQYGIVLNSKNFLSLPGLTEDNHILRELIECEGMLVGEELSPAIIYLSIFLNRLLECEIIMEKEDDPGPPPWYDN